MNNHLHRAPQCTKERIRKRKRKKEDTLTHKYTTTPFPHTHNSLNGLEIIHHVHVHACMSISYNILIHYILCIYMKNQLCSAKRKKVQTLDTTRTVTYMYMSRVCTFFFLALHTWFFHVYTVYSTQNTPVDKRKEEAWIEVHIRNINPPPNSLNGLDNLTNSTQYSSLNGLKQHVHVHVYIYHSNPQWLRKCN